MNEHANEPVETGLTAAPYQRLVEVLNRTGDPRSVDRINEYLGAFMEVRWKRCLQYVERQRFQPDDAEDIVNSAFEIAMADLSRQAMGEEVAHAYRGADEEEFERWFLRNIGHRNYPRSYTAIGKWLRGRLKEHPESALGREPRDTDPSELQSLLDGELVDFNDVVDALGRIGGEPQLFLTLRYDVHGESVFSVGMLEQLAEQAGCTAQQRRSFDFKRSFRRLRRAGFGLEARPLTQAEIADVTGYAVPTVRKRLEEGHDRLREALGVR